MQQEKHPLETIDAWLEERGLAVLENVTSVPGSGSPYICPHLVIVLCHRGWYKGKYDMHPVSFQAHDNAVIYPNHIIEANETSDDYLCTLLVISGRFLSILSQFHPNHYLFEYHYNTQFHLTDSQFETMVACMKILQSISQFEHSSRESLLIAQMDLVARIVRNFLRENGREFIHRDTAVQVMLSRFHEDVVKYYRESREVHFYAERQNLTPKYFGTVVRKATGRSVGDWIAKYIMVQSKLLLRHRLDLTIQQIASQLGFPEQASFSRYFKTHAGMTPKEFREKEAD